MRNIWLSLYSHFERQDYYTIRDYGTEAECPVFREQETKGNTQDKSV